MLLALANFHQLLDGLLLRLDVTLNAVNYRILDVLIEFVRLVNIGARAEADVRHVDEHRYEVAFRNKVLVILQVEHPEDVEVEF